MQKECVLKVKRKDETLSKNPKGQLKKLHDMRKITIVGVWVKEKLEHCPIRGEKD